MHCQQGAEDNLIVWHLVEPYLEDSFEQISAAMATALADKVSSARQRQHENTLHHLRFALSPVKWLLALLKYL